MQTGFEFRFAIDGSCRNGRNAGRRRHLIVRMAVVMLRGERMTERRGGRQRTSGGELRLLLLVVMLLHVMWKMRVHAAGSTIAAGTAAVGLRMRQLLAVLVAMMMQMRW